MKYKITNFGIACGMEMETPGCFTIYRINKLLVVLHIKLSSFSFKFISLKK
jgi:hypothetical protein